MDVDVPAAKGKRTVDKKRKTASSNKGKKIVAAASTKSKAKRQADAVSAEAEEEICMDEQPAKRTKKSPTAAAAEVDATTSRSNSSKSKAASKKQDVNKKEEKNGATSGVAKITASSLAGGVVHSLPPDFRKAIADDSKAQLLWVDITPLARNEWICWVSSAKKEDTRRHRIEAGIDKMNEGMRRPCCWPGCPHR